MPKKSRKTKAKASDFQKTKLKVGKKRPLPSNVTDVSFKSQAIYVAEQMKNVEIDEDVTEGKITGFKQNIPELLTKVGHFNKNFRVDSLTSLRIAFSNNKDVMRSYLPKVFAKVPHTIRDEDSQVRKSSIAFFKFLFSEITRQEMAPFFEAFLLHLYCAMMHIYDDVKKDSMQVFDLCIEHFPDLLTLTSSDKLLQHFIDLISTKRTNFAAKGHKGNSDFTRVLSMKLSSKESSIVWRNRVLKRLYDLLTAYEESQIGKNIEDSWQQYLKEKCDGRPIKCGSPDAESILMAFQTLKYFGNGSTSRSSIAVKYCNTQKDERLSPWERVETLVPLLLDSWHEATTDESKNLTQDSVEAMKYVLKIINVLLKRFIGSSDEKAQAVCRIREGHLQNFQKYFFDPFPINSALPNQPNLKRRKVSKDIDQDLSATIHSVNLSICELITTLFPKDLIGDSSMLLAQVAEHLSMVLVADSNETQHPLGGSGLEQSIRVTKSLLEVAMDGATADSLLRPLLVLFHNSDIGSFEKVKLFNFFSSLYSDFYFPRNDIVDEWVCSLPIFLAEIILGKGRSKATTDHTTGALCSDKNSLDACLNVMSTMRLALVKENREFASLFYEKVEFLLEILKEEGPVLFCAETYDEVMSCSGCSHCSNFMNRIFELLLHPTCEVDTANMKLMTEICHMDCIPPESVSYAAGSYLRRFEWSDAIDRTTSMQFLSSVLFGVARDEFASFQSSSKHDKVFQIKDSVTDSQFLRHTVIVEKVCLFLRTVNNIHFVLRRFFRGKLLMKYRVYPIHSVFAILRTVARLNLTNEKTSFHDELLGENTVADFNSDVGKLISSVLIHCHGNKGSLGPAVIESLTKVCVSVLELNSDLMRACIKEFDNPEHKVDLRVICQAIDFMLSQSGLWEHLNLCKSELNNALNDMQNTGDVDSSVIESTKFNVSATLAAAS